MIPSALADRICTKPGAAGFFYARVMGCVKRRCVFICAVNHVMVVVTA